MKIFACLGAAALILPLASQPVANVSFKFGRDLTQPINEEYTKKIREYTTETFFNSPLTDYLPASKTVPTPKAVLGDVSGAPGWISYLTIELRGPIPEEHRACVGRSRVRLRYLPGCLSLEQSCGPREFTPPLEKLAALTEAEFREMFRGSPVKRTKYSGFLRNVAVAMGNTRDAKFRRVLERLATARDDVTSEAARWALGSLVGGTSRIDWGVMANGAAPGID